MTDKQSANTWQTELLKDLSAKPDSPRLRLVIDQLEKHNANYETVAYELAEIGYVSYSEKLLDQYYHKKSNHLNNKLNNGLKEVASVDLPNVKYPHTDKNTKRIGDT